MRRRWLWWQTGGWLVTVIAGTLLHFVYDWSGKNQILAAFSAVNESTWEHMKLLVVPAFFFSVLQACCEGRNFPNFLAVRGVSVLAGALTIPVLFYTYTGVLGFHVLWLDVAVFLLAAAVLYFLDGHLSRSGALSAVWQQYAGVLLLWGLLFTFVWCTYRPPQFPLWQDPLTGGYGIG